MKELANYVAFVKSQSAFHERQAFRFRNDTRRFELHDSTAKKFNELAKAIEEYAKHPARPSPSDVKGMVNLTWEEVQNLPDELVAELSISDSDRSDFNIVSLIDAAGGVASIDRILVSLYQQNNTIEKRANLNARLYRMVQKGMIYSTLGKKGIYSTSEPADEKGDDNEVN